MSAGKQQLQYNLMGNKFPFLLSTWPPTTNPGARRVVNFHGKVVNFNKQRPFLCFARRSHRHLYLLAGLKCLNVTRGDGKLDVCAQVWTRFCSFSAALIHTCFSPQIFDGFREILPRSVLFLINSFLSNTNFLNRVVFTVRIISAGDFWKLKICSSFATKWVRTEPEGRKAAGYRPLGRLEGHRKLLNGSFPNFSAP